MEEFPNFKLNEHIMDRKEIIRLRPEVLIDNTDCASSIEQFQNNSLRPIIKFQHDLIIELVTTNVLFNALRKDKGPRLEFQKKVRRFIIGQVALKNQLIGFITGNMTLSEFDFYLKKQREINKRIAEMICQRISDTLY
jgi:hypothetical protein